MLLIKNHLPPPIRFKPELLCITPASIKHACMIIIIMMKFAKGHTTDASPQEVQCKEVGPYDADLRWKLRLCLRCTIQGR